MNRRVYLKQNEDMHFEEYLGEFLSIVPITYENAGEIKTDALVYFIQDDGSIGTANRSDVLIKDERHPYVRPMPEDDNLEDPPELSNDEVVDGF